MSNGHRALAGSTNHTNAATVDLARPGAGHERSEEVRRVGIERARRSDASISRLLEDLGQKHRQEANRRRQLARLAWEADHGGESPDVEWFTKYIAPRLAGLSLTEIAGALGVSTSSASKFRRGFRVPAPRHWATLAELVDID